MPNDVKPFNEEYFATTVKKQRGRCPYCWRELDINGKCSYCGSEPKGTEKKDVSDGLFTDLVLTEIEEEKKRAREKMNELVRSWETAGTEVRGEQSVRTSLGGDELPPAIQQKLDAAIEKKLELTMDKFGRMLADVHQTIRTLEKELRLHDDTIRQLEQELRRKGETLEQRFGARAEPLRLIEEKKSGLTETELKRRLDEEYALKYEQKLREIEALKAELEHKLKTIAPSTDSRVMPEAEKIVGYEEDLKKIADRQKREMEMRDIVSRLREQLETMKQERDTERARNYKIIELQSQILERLFQKNKKEVVDVLKKMNITADELMKLTAGS